ncbi:MAG: YdcF family protein [Flavobacteriales bacterium]
MLLSFQFFLRRTEFLLYPFTWVVILLLFAWFTFNAKRRKRLLSWALAILLIFSNSFIVDELVRFWEIEVVSIDAIDPEIKTAIVLGGGVYHDKETDRVKYGKNADRYLSVLQLYKAGKIEKILIAGGPANYLEPWAKESEIIKELYLLCGIPADDVLVENRSLNTHENALYSKEILAKTGEEKFLLITSSAHIRRAQACFEKQGVSVQVYPAMKGVGNRRWQLDYLLVPSLDNFSKWRGLIHEWIGFLSYKVRGYV